MKSPATFFPRMPDNFFLYLVTAGLSFLMTLRRIDDFDYWTHLALGRAYWQAKAITIKEHFVLSMLGAPLSGDEWPFQVLLYLLHKVSSDAMISLCIALTASAIFLILVSIVPPSANISMQAAVAAFFTVALFAMQFRFMPRPETVAYLLFATVLVLARGWTITPDRKKLLAIAAIFLVWSSFHLTWAIGIVLVGATLLLRPRIDFWQAELKTYQGRLFVCVVLLAAIYAVFRAVGFASFVLTDLGSRGALSAITEMRPLWEFPENFRRFTVAALCALLLSWGKADGRVRRVLIWAAATGIGVAAARNATIALIGMIPAALEGVTTSSFLHRRQGIVICGSTIITISVLVLSLRSADPPWGTGVQWHLFPRDAAAFIKSQRLPRNIFNNWDCGGYLDWAWDGDPPTFLDGRQGNDEILKDHDAVIEGRSAGKPLNRYNIKTVLLQPFYYNSGRILPGIFWILDQPDWKLVRATDALVFVRSPLPTGVYELPRQEAWRFVARHAEKMAASRSNQPHLPYSKALALYLGGDIPGSRQALIQAASEQPKLLMQYLQFFKL